MPETEQETRIRVEETSRKSVTIEKKCMPDRISTTNHDHGPNLCLGNIQASVFCFIL